MNNAYFFVGMAIVRLLAKAEDLPEHHSIGPHITLCGEATILHALWRHPAYGQHARSTNLTATTKLINSMQHLMPCQNESRWTKISKAKKIESIEKLQQ